MKRRVIAGVGAVLVIAAVIAWRLFPEQAANGPLTFYGNIDVRDVELGFRVGGRIAHLHVQEGDPVAAGDLVAELDAEPFEEEVALRRAREAEAEATRAKLEAGSRTQDIAQARAAVAEAEAVLENAVLTLKRRAALLENDDISEAAYDQAVADKRAAEARLAAAEAALDRAIEGFRTEEVAAARAAFAAARAERALAETRLADTRLYAPNHGVVLTRIREPGAMVNIGEPVLTLTLTDPVWVRAYVPETDLGRIRPGMRALVQTDSRPGKPYEGHIGFISPKAEFTPKTVETPELRTALVYRFRVVVENPDGGLRQGMPVTVTLPEAGRAPEIP